MSKIVGILAMAGFLSLAGGPASAAVSVNSSHIALYGDDFSHQVGLYTSPTFSLPNASFTYPGSPSPASTSRIVVNVDGTPYSYHSASGAPLVANGSGLGASLSGSKSVGGLDVSVRYEIVLNPQDGASPDTMMLRLTLRNPGPATRLVGARVQWDTDINNVDGANVSVNNGASVVANGTVYRQSDGNIPGNWWGYDIPPPPPTAANLVGRGSLFGNPIGVPASMPDAFEVVGWGSVSSATQWTLGAMGSPIYDSAVVLWWTGSGSETGLGHSLAPGAEISFVAYYGMNAGTLLSTFTPTPGPGVTPMPGSSPTPSVTVSPTPGPSATITPTFSITPTFTETRTPVAQTRLLKVTALYPVPFSEQLKAYYVLREDAEVSISFYNVAGEKVWSHTEPARMGGNWLHWDGVNGSGARLATGIYIGRFSARTATAHDEEWIRTAVER